MATEIIHTLKASGGDYTSFIAWEAAQQRNLVTADEVAILEFYQGDYTSSGGGDNFVDYTSSFTIDGWTTDATRKIIVRPAAGEEHAGTKDTGLRIHFTGDWNTLGVGEGYTYITGVIVNKKNYQGPGIKQVYATTDSASETVFENCISYNASSHYGYEYSTNTSSTPCIYINCLAHDCGIGFVVGDYKYSRILNCSAIGNATGFNVGKNNSQFAELKNCLGSDNSNLDFSINPSPSSSFDVDYCASEDATADDRGAASNRINQTFTFVDAVGLDFHLASADAGAIGYGVDLSSHSENPFSTDIDLESRGTTWDIGFDQYVAAASGGITGDLAATEPTDTAALSGQVLVKGNVGATESGVDTAASTGKVLLAGSLVITEALDSVSMSGASSASGTLEVTESGVDTLVASGNVPVTGALASTDIPDTLASTGKVLVKGQLATTEAIDTLSGTGKVIIAGSLAVTEAIDALAGTGVVPVSGSFSVTETGNDTAAFQSAQESDDLSAMGVHALGSETLGGGTPTSGPIGTLASTETADSITGSGKVVVQGIYSVSESQDTPTISGRVHVSGGLTVTESLGDSVTISARVMVSGNLVVTESTALDTSASTGQVLVSGALAATEATDSFYANSSVPVIGDAAITENLDYSAIGAQVYVKGNLASAEASQDTFGFTGQVIIKAGLAVSEVGNDAFVSTGFPSYNALFDATEASNDSFIAAAQRGALAVRGAAILIAI